MKERKSITIQKHNAIIEAATKLFLKHGYTKTSMDNIAQEAGSTKQTVYAHFKDKDTLFKEMVTAQCIKHAPSEEMLNDTDLGIENLLYQIGRGFLNMITSDEGLATHRLVLSEAERKPEIAKLFFETGPQRMNEILTLYLERQNAAGNLHITNTASAASYFYSMLKGRYHLRLALRIEPLPTQQELERHIHETVRVFMKIYGGDEPFITEDIMN